MENKLALRVAELMDLKISHKKLTDVFSPFDINNGEYSHEFNMFERSHDFCNSWFVCDSDRNKIEADKITIKCAQLSITCDDLLKYIELDSDEIHEIKYFLCMNAVKTNRCDIYGNINNMLLSYRLVDILNFILIMVLFFTK